jgi:preprotein translocase subunit SecE
VTTLDYRKENKRGFFAIYKPGQGKWVRWGTVIGMAIIILCGTGWLTIHELAANEVWVKALVGFIWTLAGALLTFWLVNSPKLAEFMIMTESEMRKVSWPSRREVITSTKVVILLTFLLGLLLYLVDVFFLWFFKLIGVA